MTTVEPAPGTTAAHGAAQAAVARLVGSMFLFGRTSPPVLLFLSDGTLPQTLAHLADQLDAWEREGTVPDAPADGAAARTT